MHVEFSKGEVGLRLNGSFREKSVTGMLEARYYDDNDFVSPFLGAVVDLCCAWMMRLLIVRTQYMKILFIFCVDQSRSGWYEHELVNSKIW